MNITTNVVLGTNQMSNHQRSNCENRIIIINTYPIGADCPIGIMMENLFGGYDPSHIMQYYTTDCLIHDSAKYVSQKITLTNTVFAKLKLVICMLREIKKRITMKSNDLDNRVESKLISTGASNSSLMSWKLFLVPVHIDKDTLDKIKKFRPTVIYTQGYSFTMLKYINLLSKKISCPVVIHTLDDWMETQYNKDLISKVPFYYFTKLFKRMLNNGKDHMVISPKMGKYMENKYGGKYSFVMNCCSYPPYIKNNCKSSVMNLIYTGGLMLERHVMLNEIAKCINDINKNVKVFELHIYAPLLQINAYRNLMDDSIIFHDYVKQEEVSKVLAAGDILLHTESFNDNIIRFTNYSLSTKIPECLASGRPLIYYGPSTIGVAEFLSEEGIGIVADNIVYLREQLILLYHDNDYYEKVASTAYEYGKNNLEKQIMQSRMKSSLINR